MISAIQSALSGLRTATARFEQAAFDIVSAPSATSEAVSGTGDAAETPAAPVGTAFSDRPPVFADDTSLVSSIVDLKEAATLYKASAKVLGTIGDLEQRLLDITG